MKIKYLISVLIITWNLSWVSGQPFVQENVFIHYDRDVYFSGEKIWMKLYVKDAAFNRLTTFSKVAYVELWSPDGNPVSQLRVALSGGMGQVTLALEPGLPTGYYQLRAYTRWMSNGPSDNFFVAPVVIVNPEEEIPVFDELLENHAQDLIVRLFPEGGNLIEGLESRVGISVTDEWGRGVETSGWISDISGVRQVEFFTDDRGLGVFSVNGDYERALKVFVRKKDGNPQQVLLPDSKETGVSLFAEQDVTGEISVEISSTLPDTVNLTIHLERGGVVLAPIPARLTDGNSKVLIPSGFFPEGMLEILVKDQGGIIHARRNFWMTDPRPLRVEVQLSSEKVAAGTPIFADIQTTDLEGNPRPAVVSLSAAKKSPLPFGFVERSQTLNDLDMLCSPLLPVASGKPPGILPELYGISVSGRVRGNLPGSGARVYLAIPGKSPYVRLARPNGAGRFTFQLTDLYGVKELVVFGVDSAGNPLKVELDPAVAGGFPPPVSPTLSFSRAEASRLKEMYLNQQIAAVYESQAGTSEPLSVPAMAPFYGQAERKYHLDEYTRFSIEETFIEIVYQVHVLHRQGKAYLRIYDQYQNVMLEEDPLMLVDGIPFLEAEQLLNINTRKVEDVEVLSTLYYGDKTFFQGMVHLITYEGKGEVVKLPEHYLRQNYSFFTAGETFLPVAGPEKQKPHLPDFRNLLHWAPDIRTNEAGKARISFFTSDAAGEYEVRVFALTSDGMSETVVTQLHVVNP